MRLETASCKRFVRHREFTDLSRLNLLCRFEGNDNVVMKCPVTCFDGSTDLHDQDSKSFPKQIPAIFVP